MILSPSCFTGRGGNHASCPLCSDPNCPPRHTAQKAQPSLLRCRNRRNSRPLCASEGSTIPRLGLFQSLAAPDFPDPQPARHGAIRRSWVLHERACLVSYDHRATGIYQPRRCGRRIGAALAVRGCRWLRFLPTGRWRRASFTSTILPRRAEVVARQRTKSLFTPRFASAYGFFEPSGSHRICVTSFVPFSISTLVVRNSALRLDCQGSISPRISSSLQHTAQALFSLMGCRRCCGGVLAVPAARFSHVRRIAVPSTRPFARILSSPGLICCTSTDHRHVLRRAPSPWAVDFLGVRRANRRVLVDGAFGRATSSSSPCARLVIVWPFSRR